MAQRHLRELLREEQEPFALKSFIDERRDHLRKHQTTKKRASIPQSSGLPSIPSNESPPLLTPIHDPSNPKKSPVFDLASKSPASGLKPTLYLILEAALRIQENDKCRRNSRRSIKGLGFGFFGSVLKRLVLRKRRCEIGGKETRVSVKDILVWEPPYSGKCRKKFQLGSSLQKRTSPSPPPMDASRFQTNANQVAHNEIRATNLLVRSSPERVSDVKVFCSVRLDENRSPAGSPCRSQTEERQLFDGTRAKREYDEEQRKEKQFSPVSVLDPAFDEEGEEEDEEEDRPGGYVESVQRSLAIVQRTKRQLMNNLRRFERLAALDPIELDKLLAVEEDDDGDNKDYDYDGGDSGSTHLHIPVTESEETCKIITAIVSHSGLSRCCCVAKIPRDMKMLISDMAKEEELADEKLDEEAVAESVCKRFEGWKEVDSNTIDMMVELDLNRQSQEWKRCMEQVQEIAMRMEMSIFELLICELSVELA